MKKNNHLAVSTALLAIAVTFNSYANQAPLTFAQVIKTAQQNDPWLEGSRQRQESLELMSKSVNTQPDPSMSIAFANLPTDGFDNSQEAMTQFKVGVSQMFARGDSLAIKNKQLLLQSQQQPLQRQDRLSKVAVTVGSLWLNLFRVEQSINLIEKNRNLFEQLNDLVEASYGSGLGKTRQYDIVRSQLELTRLEDRLNQLKLEQSRYQGLLSQWLNQFSFNGDSTVSPHLINSDMRINISDKLPVLTLLQQKTINNHKGLKPEQLALLLATHPSVLSLDKSIAATSRGVDLAQQKYQPQWGINASYGFRDDDPMGNSRADLFTLGVVFDVPLFTSEKQDNEVKAAVANTQAIKTEKLLLIRQLMSAFSSAKGQLQRVKERQTLYEERLMPQIHDQAQASLTAYTNDDGDFSEVVRARIAELNAQIDFLALNVQEQKLILELNYLFVGTTTASAIGEA